MTLQRSSRSAVGAIALSSALLLGACGSDAADTAANTPSTESVASGVQIVSPEDAKAQIDAGREDLVVLDVRTQEEYDESHLANAVLIDFYGDDFADQMAELDPSVPYVLYCRSGSRSGQTRAMMVDLGFEEVYDVDGGITSWTAAGLPTE